MDLFVRDSDPATDVDPATSEATVGEDTVGEDTVGEDYFVVRDGEKFAGLHLLVDLWGAELLDDPQAIDRALCAAAGAAKATILHSHFHRFSPNGGVSGVVVLAESHISIHTWPERDFAAVDIFMCGACDPYDSLPILRQAFAPERMDCRELRRGLLK